MTKTPSLEARIVAEIRAEMARQTMPGVQLADRVGRSQSWITKRLTLKTPLSVDDLALIAAGLTVPALELHQRAEDLAPIRRRRRQAA